MKRDMDLARQILLELEAAPYPRKLSSIEIEGRSKEEVNYHVMLLNEANLIEALDLTASDGIRWVPTRLTWHGHEFLDAARDQTRWNRAKDIARERAGSLTFDVLKAVLTQLTRQAVGL